ncbi:hypothetical protein [Amedibacillus sp. YH-ame10]
MNNAMLLVLISIVMMVIAIPFIIRSLLWNRVLKQLHKGRYEDVLKNLHSNAFKLFFSEYDRQYNCLRVYLAKSENKKIEEQTKVLLAMKLSEQQAYQVASQTYFYFLEKGNKEICSQMLEFIKNKADEETIRYNSMLYRVMIEKKYEDIEPLERMLVDMEQAKVKKDYQVDHQVQMGILQYLLALQYSYKKDRKMMEAYVHKAKGNLKGTPYYKKVKQLYS